MAQAEEIKTQIDAMLQNIEGLPSFPSIVQKVLSMVSNPDANFQELKANVKTELQEMQKKAKAGGKK